MLEAAGQPGGDPKGVVLGIISLITNVGVPLQPPALGRSS